MQALFTPMFRDKGTSPSLVGYLPALYPDEASYVRTLDAARQAGLRYLEIGIPSVDPYLDGKAISEALLSVQKEHPDVQEVVQKAVGAVHSAGLVGIVMLYYETVEQYGLAAFANLLVEVGADGVLVPNIPAQQRHELAVLLAGSSVATVNFVRYETEEPEMQAIIADTTGFLYLQSMKGATGGQFVVDETLENKVRTLRSLAREAALPVALGFGISTPASARKAAETEADAIIVGTGLVVAAKRGTKELGAYLAQFAPYLQTEVGMQYLLSVDIGTTALKSSLIARDGAVVASQSEEYPLHANGSAMEQDPQLWWEAFCKTSRALTEKHPHLELSAVVLSGQMQDLIMVDAQNNVVGNAMLYSDTRCQEEFAQYEQEFGLERAMRITLNGCDAASLPPKVLYLKKQHGSLADTQFLLGSHDYLCWKLTGTMVTDLTNAATTGLLDYEANAWSEEILQYVGLKSGQLPRLEQEPCTTGMITKEAAEATGLRQGLVVIHGSGDAGSSTVGVGAADEQVFSCYLGTSGWIAATLPSAIDPKMGVFNLRHPDGKQTITIGAMRTTGGNISWLLEAFKVGGNKYAQLQEVAGNAPVGSGGLFYLPYLQGERMPFNDPFARGAFIGLTRDTSQSHMFRAVIEGVAYGMATIYEVLREVSTSSSVRVVASGGGAENRLLGQTLADILGVPVLKMADASNAGVKGNLVLAGKVLGWFDSYALPEESMQIEETFLPHGEAHAYHQKAFVVFKRLYAALKDEFCAIANIEREKGE
ncbi:MAG: tryptophan synthase subunit alpha [Sphaerochaeta sp.]